MDEDRSEGFRDGLSGSTGDPRVVFALNAILSVVFATVVVWGLAAIGSLSVTVVNVVSLAIVLFVVTYLVV